MGFIIFLIIAIVSVIKRIREMQQEEERRNSLPKTRPEDLPEATRRMLYGDTQVPTARERQAPQQPPVIVARPRQMPQQDQEGPRPVPPPRPFTQPPPLTPTVRPMPLPIPPRPMQPSRPVVMQPRRMPTPQPPRPSAAMPPPNVARQFMSGDDGADFDARAASDRTDGEWVMRQEQERRRQAEQARMQAATRARAAKKQRILAPGADLRRAILMNEILGPPIALRDPFGPFPSGPMY